MMSFRIGVLVLVVVLGALVVRVVTAQAPTLPVQKDDGAPTLAERDVLVLTVMQQQVEIATLRLQRAVADLKKPGWRVDLVNGQWVYLPIAGPDP